MNVVITFSEIFY
uniref:Uncharacterized protein n=1 Tax=Arundo donax TaxID=35708 RepID=A0A0A8Z612_ARUDO